MSQGRRAAVRRVSIAAWPVGWRVAWLVAAAVSASACSALNASPRRSPAEMIGICRATLRLEPKEPIVKGGYVGRDANVHFTVEIPKNVPSGQQLAFREAMKRWNKWSEVTRTVLEEGQPSGPFDITLKETDDPYALCAVRHNGIGYNAKGMEFAEKDHKLAARIYVHELGHMFGIDHPHDGGLMDEDVYRHNSPDCEAAAIKVEPIRRQDAENARDCAFQAHVGHQYRLPPK